MRTKTDHPRVLLVEDEAVTALLEERYLTKRGMSVLHAQSGDEAVRLAAENDDIDLVLMDIDLGEGIDGTEASLRILAIRELPIVFLTSHSEQEMVERVKGITSYGYVLKSAGEFVLSETVAMALDLFEARKDIRRQNDALAEANAELRRTNEALSATERQSEERRRYLEALLRYTPVAVVTLDRDHRVVEWNRGAEAMFGYTASEATGRPIDELVAPLETKGAKEARQLTHKVLANPQEILVETVRYTRDLSPINVVIAGAPIMVDGVCIGLVVTYKDVTKERRSQERYRLLADNSLDVIALLGPDLRPIYVSPSITRLTGYETRHYYSRRLPDAVAEEDVAVLSEHLAEGLASDQESSRCTYRMKTRDGERVVVEGVFRYLRGQAGTGIVMSQREITDRVETEERLIRQTERARRLAEEKELLLREIYHRVKNDMSLVRSLLALQAEQAKDPQLKQHLNEATRRVSVVSQVYGRLSHIGRIDRVNLRTFVEDVLSDIGRATADIEVEALRDDLWVSSRASTAVGIILNELVTNATKYARIVGARPLVTVRLAADEAGAISLAVADNGTGFPEDVIAGKRRGLGMTIVEALAAQYDGTVAIGNAGGATVEVTLPAASDL